MQFSMLLVLAHPDDEAFGAAGTVAKYTEQGVQTYLVTATRGEAGMVGEPPLTTRERLGEIREQELRCSCEVLGIHRLFLLGYRDGTLDKLDPTEIEAKIVRIVRMLRPQVIVTFEPGGIYGHPDHVTISRTATAAFHSAGDASKYPEQLRDGLSPYAPAKLYYITLPKSQARGLELEIEGIDDSLITTDIDISNWLSTKLAALYCHRTQAQDYAPLVGHFNDASLHYEHFILAQSRLPKIAGEETDLFEGLR